MEEIDIIIYLEKKKKRLKEYQQQQQKKFVKLIKVTSLHFW